MAVLVHPRRTATFATAALIIGASLSLLALVKPGPGAASAQSEAAPAAPAEPREASLGEMIGLDRARARMGDALPTGKGIVAGHVESEPGKYMPDVKAPKFSGVTFVPRNGPSEPFGHTTGTANLLYGNGRLAEGVETVHCFATNMWLGGSYLRAGLPVPPAKMNIRVFNHSWIGLASEGTQSVLRRVDYVIDRDDVIMCVGVNNGRQSRVPALLGSAYNVIAVGTASGDGASSGGYTAIEVDGRCKPDIVGPRGLTSFATPVVTGAAIRLLELGDRIKATSPGAVRAETIKALLLAGATKPWNWRPDRGRPLDEHLGAGVVNLDWSLRMLEAGQSAAGSQAGNLGWDFAELEQGATASHEFATENAGPLSVALTWHRRIDGRVSPDLTNQPQWVDTPRMANFDLRLVFVAPSGRSGVIARSESAIDNVEHIYLAEAPPGTYRIEIVRTDDGLEEAWDYAVAWRSGHADVTRDQ